MAGLGGLGAMKLGEGLLQMQGWYDKQRMDRDEQKRKAPMEELALLLAKQNAEKGGMELDETKRVQAMGAEGRGALAGYERDEKDASKIPADFDVPAPSSQFMGGVGPISPNRYNELAEVAKMGPLKYAQSSGLAKYAPYEEGVKSTLDMLKIGGTDDYKTAQANLMQQRAEYLQAQMENARTPEERLKLQMMLENMKHGNRLQALDFGADRGIKTKVKTQQAVEGAKTEAQFNRVKSMFKKLWSTKKAGLDEPPIKGGGAVVGRLKDFASKAQVPGFESVAAYEGQLTETALAMMPILTGQNRLIESIAERVRATLPEAHEKESYAAVKVEQSIRNAMGIKKALEASGITGQDLDALADEELQNPDSPLNATIRSLPAASLDADEERTADELVMEIIGYIPTKRKRGNSPLPVPQGRDYGKEYDF